MKMKRFLTSCLVIIFMVTIFPTAHLGGIGQAVFAASMYYVSPTGNDTNPGTQSEPWSLSKANSTAAAGDTVILANGEYTDQIAPENSGTTGAAITFKAQNPGQVLLKGDIIPDGTIVDFNNPDPKLWAIYIAGKSYINVEGMHVEMQSTYYGRWLKVTQDGSGNRAHDINVSNCVMENATGSEDTLNAWNENCPVTLAYCDNIRLTGNIISELRRMDDMFGIKEATNIVLDGNQISKAPHVGLGVEDFGPWFSTVSNLVLRNNVFNSQWGRNCSIFPTKNVLIEGNIFSESINGGAAARGGDELFPNQCIYRFNRVMRNSDFAMELGPWIDDTGEYPMFVKNCRFYNNVFAENPKSVFVFGMLPSQITNNVIKNNIFYKNDNNADYVNLRYVEDDTKVKFQNNLLWHGDGIEPNFVSWNTLEKHTLSDLQPSAQFSNNTNADPLFVNATDYNFALGSGSPAIDTAEALTTATNAGDNSTSLTVADARYFYDGWGISGEVGDIISVGSASNTARITAVDYTANTITLDQALSWAEGATVNLAYSGSGPDLGMYEMGSDGRVSVQVDSQPFKITAGNSATLTATVRGACTPSAYSWNFGDGSALGSGSSVSHIYSSAGQYAIFCTVTADDGKVYKGCSYVIVQAPDALTQPMRTCTFDATDTDWEEYINTGVRDSLYNPISVEQKFDGADGYLRLFAMDADKDLWAEIAPNEWNIDQYPVVKADYKIKPGTPVAMYVRAFPSYNWDDNFTQGYRFVYLASSTACGIRTDMELIDDDQWHTIQIDARAIRNTYPGVTFANAVGFKNTGTPAEVGNEWYLDNFSIEPSGNLIRNPGFDDSTTSPWTVSGGWTGSNYTVSTTSPRSTEKCIKIDGTSSGKELYQTVAVTPNTDYTFSFYGKVGEDGAIRYYVYTPDWMNFLAPPCRCAVSGSWTQYATTFNSGNNISVIIAIGDYGGATTYIDDFDLRSSASALAAAKAAAAKTEANYTIASWGVLTTALAMPETTIAEVAAKTTAINNAIAGLVLKTDLTAYNLALAAVVRTDYTAESWTTYQGVVAANIVTTENMQSEVDTATANIIAAQGNLVFALVQKAVSAVTASKNDATAYLTIDGEITEASSWFGDGDGVSITYDLGNITNVSKLNIAWCYGASQKTTYDIAVSTDGTIFTNVVSSAQSSGTTLDFQPISFTAVSARYVRIIGHGNTSAWPQWCSISEVEIYEVTGEASPAADLTAYNSALAAVVQAYYTAESWTAYQGVVAANAVTTENTQSEVDTATANITAAQGSLVFVTLTPGENLVLNPGCDDLTPSPWGVSGGWGSSLYTVSTDSPLSTPNCIKLNGDGLNLCDLWQTVAVTKNTDYTFSFYGKVGAANAISYYVCTTDWCKFIATPCNCAASSDWTQYTATFNSGDNTSVLLVIAGQRIDATSYIDDVDLRSSALSPTPIQADLETAEAAAAAKTEADYTIASWGVLTAALAMPEATIAEALAKTTAINNAITGLIPISIASVKELIAEFTASGELKNPLLAQLSNNLEQAQHQMDIGSSEQGVKHLKDFSKHLNNPVLSNSISEEARSVLDVEVTKLITGLSKE